MEKTPDKAPNCLKCAYFSVSWDPKFPRRCAVFGIKSVRMPSEEVFLATGRHCPTFKKNERLKDYK
ncbi:MAG: hypothetical protein JW760_04825 [Spirochaetales bacterium]|nr:hypothetical protein [Spirochaetales bacterium]